MKTIGLIALAAAGVGIGYLLYADRGQQMVGEAKDTASDAIDQVQQGAQSALDTAKSTVENTVRSTRQMIGDGMASAQRTASAVGDQITQSLGMNDESDAHEMIAGAVQQPHPDTAMAHAFEEALTEA